MAMEKAPGENQQKQSRSVWTGELCLPRVSGDWPQLQQGPQGPLPLAQGQGEMGRTPRMWQLPEMHLLMEEAGAT